VYYCLREFCFKIDQFLISIDIRLSEVDLTHADHSICIAFGYYIYSNYEYDSSVSAFSIKLGNARVMSLKLESESDLETTVSLGVTQRYQKQKKTI